jgi:alcohol dehydrogenase class IV
MRFEFATAGRIVFGPGAIGEAGIVARSFGKRAFLVTGRDPNRAERLTALLEASGLAATRFSATGEPTLETVATAVALARQEGCDVVIGFGGGGAIDTAKAVSALLANQGALLDYLEVIGGARPLDRPSLPCVAIPTTAGTGAEVTRNAVLGSPSDRLKVSLRGPSLLPRVAIVDPELTHGLPPALTAATGLDALAQLIEPFVSCRAGPLTDGFCREGIRRAARSLRTAFREGGNSAAREDMAYASLCGGLALANAGLGAVHGIASPVGGMFEAPHGAVCAALLAPAMEVNIRAARGRQPDGPAVGRFAEIARLLSDDPRAGADEGPRWIRRLVADLGLPGLRAYGVRTDSLGEIASKASRASSMKANPLPLANEEVLEILAAAL